jgi:hypothetical protein
MVHDTLAIIRARRRAIETQIAALHSEDGELAAAERGLARLTGARARSSAPSHAAPAPARRGRKPASGDKSQRDLILAVLSQDDWLDLQDIVLAIARDHGVSVAKRTISPLLSALKREGLIVRQRRKVALAAKKTARRTSS